MNNIKTPYTVSTTDNEGNVITTEVVFKEGELCKHGFVNEDGTLTFTTGKEQHDRIQSWITG